MLSGAAVRGGAGEAGSDDARGPFCERVDVPSRAAAPLRAPRRRRSETRAAHWQDQERAREVGEPSGDRGELPRAVRRLEKKRLPMDTENPKRRKTFARAVMGAPSARRRGRNPRDASRSFAASTARINAASCGLRRASPRARSRRRPGRNSARDRRETRWLEPRGAPEPAPGASRETRKAPGREGTHSEARGRWVARRTLSTRPCDARCIKGSHGRDGGPLRGISSPPEDGET